MKLTLVNVIYLFLKQKLKQYIVLQKYYFKYLFEKVQLFLTLFLFFELFTVKLTTIGCILRTVTLIGVWLKILYLQMVYGNCSNMFCCFGYGSQYGNLQNEKHQDEAKIYKFAKITLKVKVYLGIKLNLNITKVGFVIKQ